MLPPCCAKVSWVAHFVLLGLLSNLPGPVSVIMLFSGKIGSQSHAASLCEGWKGAAFCMLKARLMHCSACYAAGSGN